MNPGLKIYRLRGTPPPVIIADMETMAQLLQMVQVGWAVQLMPQGNGRAWLLWTRERDAENRLLDGDSAIPHLQCISLIEFPRAVAEFHARVFPVSPFGDLPVDSPFRDM